MGFLKVNSMKFLFTRIKPGEKNCMDKAYAHDILERFPKAFRENVEDVFVQNNNPEEKYETIHN